MNNPPMSLLRALRGETLPRPPIWLMRQAGRYLPEYLATRARAGSFLDLCYDSELATEVTLQPIRRFDFDAAILFADILLLPQAIGRKLWFETGEGPRLEPLTKRTEVDALADDEQMHAHLAPVYQTVRSIRAQLPRETALIGFAGAPWTVATYVIAGRGKDEQAGALAMMHQSPDTFAALMHRLETATVAYLSAQIAAGADVVKLFDSWAGALAPEPEHFRRWCIEPTARIVTELSRRHPDTPVIGFPRGARQGYDAYANETAVMGLALDESVSLDWARDVLQKKVTIQGNVDPSVLVTGGEALHRAVNESLDKLSSGPYIFNLGHGITPDADPANVEIMVRLVKG